MPKRVRGGDRLKRWVKAAKRNARRNRPTEVGFFPGQKYEDGTSVPFVAALHEYGIGELPERPFMRPATERSKPEVARIIREGLRGRAAAHPFDLPRDVALRAGGVLAQTIRDTIDSYRDDDTGKPALVDTGLMRDSVEVRVAGRPDAPE